MRILDTIVTTDVNDKLVRDLRNESASLLLLTPLLYCI
jgi:hypothetical protein